MALPPEATTDHDRPRISWSTSQVDPKERFAAWHELICEQLLKVRARVASPEDFSAAIDVIDCPGFQLVRARASRHELRVTRRTIAMNDHAFFSVAFPSSGRVVVEQDRSQASLVAGEFAFWDTTRPASLRIEADASLIVVRTPMAWAESLIAGPSQRDRQLARRFGHVGGSALVADYVHGLDRLYRQHPEQARILAVNVPALLGSVLGLAGGRRPDRTQAQALGRAQVVKYLQRHLRDPSLDADTVAKEFNVSRRTLYRLFAGFVDDQADGAGEELGHESLHTTLLRLRANYAMQLMRSDQDLPLRVVAHACGFGTEATLYRSFLRFHGRSPGQYRDALRSGPASERVPSGG